MRTSSIAWCGRIFGSGSDKPADKMPVGGGHWLPSQPSGAGLRGRSGWAPGDVNENRRFSRACRPNPGDTFSASRRPAGGSHGSRRRRNGVGGAPPGYEVFSSGGATTSCAAAAGVGHRVVAPPTVRGLGGPSGPKPLTPGPHRRPSGRLIPRTAQGGIYTGRDGRTSPHPGCHAPTSSARSLPHAVRAGNSLPLERTSPDRVTCFTNMPNAGRGDPRDPPGDRKGDRRDVPRPS